MSSTIRPFEAAAFQEAETLLIQPTDRAATTPQTFRNLPLAQSLSVAKSIELAQSAGKAVGSGAQEVGKVGAGPGGRAASGGEDGTDSPGTTIPREHVDRLVAGGLKHPRGVERGARTGLPQSKADLLEEIGAVRELETVGMCDATSDSSEIRRLDPLRSTRGSVQGLPRAQHVREAFT